MNMYVTLFVLLAASCAMSAPSSARNLPALQHEEIHDAFGQYALRYVTAEGTMVSERGHLVPSEDGRDYVMVMDGETSYIGDDGRTYITKYSSGFDGAHFEGAHLPIAPVATH